MKPNILFLLIDGLRGDKCHGNNKYDRILSAMDIWIGKILESAEKSLKNNGKNIKL